MTALSLDSTSSSSFDVITGKIGSIFSNYNNKILKPAGDEIAEIFKDYRKNIAYLLLGDENINNNIVINSNEIKVAKEVAKELPQKVAKELPARTFTKTSAKN